MDSDGSNIKCLTSNLDQIPSAPMWASNNSGVYFNVREFGRSNVYFADLRGKVNKITNGNHMLTMNDLVGKNAVATWTDPSNPMDILYFNIENSDKMRRLTNVNKDIFYNVEFGKVEEITYKSVDEKMIQGWIVKPPLFDSSKKYPLVLRIHGGPHSMYHVGFNYNFQLHAAQDQVVLYTNLEVLLDTVMILQMQFKMLTPEMIMTTLWRVLTKLFQEVILMITKCMCMVEVVVVY